MDKPIVEDCLPPDGFSGCVSVSVLIHAAPDKLYDLVTDIENLSAFWPDYEFRRDGTGTLEPNTLYYSRQKGQRQWVPYSVEVLEPNRRMVGEMVGGDRFFERLRYEHTFTASGSGVLSQEKVVYRLRYGILGRIADRLIVRGITKKQVLGAHLRLKQKAEADKARGDREA
ncbi:MAG: SRPBCC family protein [Chloroflexi bacterium]|nr:SRPBCC family protein [Chloroflexota bacterium]